MLGRDSCRNGLRNEIFLFARNAVVKRPSMHGRQLFSKVTMSGWDRGHPLQTIRVPRIPLHDPLPRENTDEKVQDKYQLSSAEDKREGADEYINRLLRLQEDVLRWVINPAHLAADADDVHREEHTVGTDKREPEVEFAEAFIHEPAEHLREPEIQTCKCRK